MEEKVSVLKNINKFISSKKEDLWTGTLEDYIELVIKNPGINMMAHARVLKMINGYGIEKMADDSVRYNFFKNEIFGADVAIEELMTYLRAAATGSEVSRRILLMYGPTSSGKSQMAIMLKRGLEKFSHTDEGAIYRIAESPMSEDPLWAVPEEFRGDFLKEHGIKIEGSLSPLTALILREKYDGNFLKLPVERYYISEKNRTGIGTFVPSDKKSQDISELIGSMDLSTIGQYGSESDPRAYRWDGEIEVGNRGVLEFVEMLKVDQKFLYVLLTLAQEKNIKTPRFPLIYADEMVLGHSVVGDEPIPYRKDGKIHFDTIKNLTQKNDTSIEVIAMNLDTRCFEWTGVVSFYSHLFTGNLVKTIQKNGVIETTDHHSIYNTEFKCFYPEDKNDILSMRSVPEHVKYSKFTLPLTDDMTIDSFGMATIKDIPGNRGNGHTRKKKVMVEYDIEKDEQAILDILMIFAWYITEGHVNDRHFVISQNRTAPLKLIQEAAHRIGTYKVSVNDRSDASDKTSRAIFTAKIWRDLIIESCGKYSEHKKIPDFVFSLPTKYIKYFLDEMIKGDGTRKCYGKWTSEEYKQNNFRYKTVSKMLAAQVGFLASLLGINYSINKGVTTTGKNSYDVRYRAGPGFNKQGENKIITTMVEDVMVFDIECIDNHSFVAGVGQVLCHNTNFNEYSKFLAKEEMEALHDRLIVVRVPYNLSVSDEVKIYEKLIAQSNFNGVHISPHALCCAAMFSVLSRLKDSSNKNITLVTKMKLYDGQSIDGYTPTDVVGTKLEFGDEGMNGISPRYIINRISSILSETGATCITPIDVIRSIRDGFKSNAKLDVKEVSRLEGLLTIVIDEYSKIAKNDVQKAFFLNFEEEVTNLLENYLENVNAFLDGSKVEDDELGNLVEPNEKLMRAIEEKIQVTETGKRSFRQEISRKMARSSSQNSGVANYKEHVKLREALEKQLFEERQDIIRLTVSTRITDESALKKLNVVIETLCDKYGYSAESANKLLRYVSSVMART